MTEFSEAFDAHPFRAQLPPGSMINCEIVITSYFDTDGKLKYATNVAGDPNLAQALGLCELAKHAMYQSYLEDEPYPADDEEDEESDDDR